MHCLIEIGGIENSNVPPFVAPSHGIEATIGDHLMIPAEK